MKNNTALNWMLLLNFLVIIFHLGILLRFIPYGIAWGGRLKNDQDMYIFECVSIGVILILIFTLLLKGKYLKPQVNNRILNFILWIYFVIFVLNTLGNVLAKTNFEKIFSIVTLISAILIWKIIRAKKEVQ